MLRFLIQSRLTVLLLSLSVGWRVGLKILRLTVGFNLNLFFIVYFWSSPDSFLSLVYLIGVCLVVFFRSGVPVSCFSLFHHHTGYPETTNATENNKRYWNQYEVIGSKYLSGNTLPRISLIRGKLFTDRYLHTFPPVDFNCVYCCQSRWLSRGDRCDHSVISLFIQTGKWRRSIVMCPMGILNSEY